MKKIISLILALAMIMTLAVSASAASISIARNNPEGSTVSSDVKYTAYRLLEAEISDAGVTYYVYASDANKIASKYFVKTFSADGTKCYISLSETGEAATAEQLASALQSNRTVPSFDIPYDSTTDTYHITGVPEGYYYVANTLQYGRIVETLGDVEITEKLEYPTIVKTVNGKSAATVDNKGTVEFELTIAIPQNFYTYSNCFVYDETDGVTIDVDSIQIDAPEMANSDPLSITYENGKLTIKFIEYFFKGNLGKEIKITYTGTVDALTEDATNKAYLAFGPDNNPYYVSTDSSVVISNAKIPVYKYDGTTNEPLAGAGFVLAKKDPVSLNVTGYYKMDNGTVSWVTAINDATVMTSGNDGYTPNFEGLAEGNYWLIEKVVPDGYNQAEDQIVEITVNNSGIAMDHEEVRVMNNSGSELPSTGGVGTTLFYVFGSMMMLSAAVLLITKRRVA